MPLTPDQWSQEFNQLVNALTYWQAQYSTAKKESDRLEAESRIRTAKRQLEEWVKKNPASAAPAPSTEPEKPYRYRLSTQYDKPLAQGCCGHSTEAIFRQREDAERYYHINEQAGGTVELWEERCLRRN